MAALLTGRSAALQPFLADAEAAPFAWGAWDCMTTLANWAQRLTGSDPAVHLRDAYSDQEGWTRLVARLGGLPAVLADCAGRAGMVRATEPLEAGDIALVELPRHPGYFGGIYAADGRFAVKTMDGLVSWRARWLRPAWRLPCP